MESGDASTMQAAMDAILPPLQVTSWDAAVFNARPVRRALAQIRKRAHFPDPEDQYLPENERHHTIVCPECGHEFRLLIDDDEVDEEYDQQPECPECGVEIDPDTV